MLTIAIRARLASRANFAAIQQTALADIVPREALDEALLAALRGSISGTTSSVVPGQQFENLLEDKYGTSSSGTGVNLTTTDSGGASQAVITLTVSNLSPAISPASRLNGRKIGRAHV